MKLLHYQGVPPPGEGAIIARYRRYSSGRQKATTLAKQAESTNEALMEMHPTWRIEFEYADPKRSARLDTLDNRPEMLRLLEDARRGLFKAVIVESVDRWSRSEKATYDSLSVLHKAGVHWLTADGFNSVNIREDGTSTNFAHAVASAAQLSRTISKKVSRGLATRARLGYHGSIAPFGYKLGDPDENDRRPLVPDENYPALALIAEWRIAGWSAREIAIELNARGYRAHNLHQRQFQTVYDTKDGVGITPRLVQSILNNRFYVRFRPDGDRGITRTRHDTAEREGRHVAAWTQEQWEAMREVAERLNHAPNAIRAKRRRYPFGGMICCASCGLIMRGTCTKEIRYYTCRGMREGVLHQLPLSVRCEIVEKSFGAILERFNQPSWRIALEQALASAKADEPEPVIDPRERVQAAIERENIKFDVLGKDYEADYRKRVGQLRQELHHLTKLQSQHLERQREAADHLASIAMCWEAAALVDRREMANLLLEHPGIIFDRQSKTIIALRPHKDFWMAFREALQWIEHDHWLWISPEAYA